MQSFVSQNAMIHKVLNFMIRLKQGAPLGLSWYTKYASWSPNLRYRMRIATYSLIYLPIYSCLLVEYSTEKCLFLGVSKYEKGVGYVYSKSKGRGHDNFFLGNPPVFSFATVRKYPESAPDRDYTEYTLHVVELFLISKASFRYRY